MNREDDREVLKNARPFIRSVAAFLLYLRFGTPMNIPIEGGSQNYGIDTAHVDADHFLNRLDKDLGK